MHVYRAAFAGACLLACEARYLAIELVSLAFSAHCFQIVGILDKRSKKYPVWQGWLTPKYSQ